mgnify:CR=1 FL=1
MKKLNSVSISGFDVLPLVEGGKGVAVTNGSSAGAWASAGAVGTFSGVNADSYDISGNVIPQIYKGRTRIERHDELINYAIKGAIEQAQIAYEKASGRGPVHMNVLWEMAAAEKILNNEDSLKLDEMADKSIKAEKLKNKLTKISNILKTLK